jgi:hypothetical protein
MSGEWRMALAVPHGIGCKDFDEPVCIAIVDGIAIFMDEPAACAFRTRDLFLRHQFNISVRPG